MINISVILLNYNSFEDLINCYSDLNKQINVRLTYIIIDNKSNNECIKEIKKWENNTLDGRVISGTLDTLTNRTYSNNIDTFIIYNRENNGYSAGNNLGIKLSEFLKIENIIIANPDMRFDNELYCYELYKTLLSSKDNAISSSRIIGLDNKDQSPIREITPLEEIFWFKNLLPYFKKKVNYIESFNPNSISNVNKIMGCCFIIKLDFLKIIGYFDETTFLYSEEAILSSQLRKYNKKISFNSNIYATHAHDTTKKDNSSKRMLIMIKSRKYYLKQYSNYNKTTLFFMSLSYSMLSLLHKIKYKLKG